MTTTREPLRVRRTMTAAEIGARVGLSARTVRRYQAESRAAFLERALERRTLAAACRAAGYSFHEIAAVLQTSYRAAQQLVLLHQRHQAA